MNVLIPNSLIRLFKNVLFEGRLHAMKTQQVGCNNILSESEKEQNNMTTRKPQRKEQPTEKMCRNSLAKMWI